jgi:hypothetical protein
MAVAKQYLGLVGPPNKAMIGELRLLGMSLAH